MSFVIGAFSGALVAGGVYYGFSNMIQSSTGRHTTDLHTLSRRLVDASTDIPAPRPASERIEHKRFNVLVRNRWNAQIGTIFESIRGLDQRAVDWTRNVLYGGDARPKQE